MGRVHLDSDALALHSELKQAPQSTLPRPTIKLSPVCWVHLNWDALADLVRQLIQHLQGEGGTCRPWCAIVCGVAVVVAVVGGLRGWVGQWVVVVMVVVVGGEWAGHFLPDALPVHPIWQLIQWGSQRGMWVEGARESVAGGGTVRL